MPAADDKALADLVRQLADALTARRASVATAESCTGGLLSKLLTDRPGSSNWFGYGFITYANDAKTDLLGVDRATLAAQGAVSADVAEQMATGARVASGAEIAVAITGIAGPDGGGREKPVGTVYIAIAGPGERLESKLHEFAGDRDAVRRAAVHAALTGLVRALQAT